MALHLRELHSMEDLNTLVELQLSIWGMQPQECASPYTLNAAIHNGGCVIGAEIEGRLVGFCFGFAAKRGDEIWLWSHMAGVDPKHQGRQIGSKLKFAQKDWALEHGYKVMGWTFQPMQRGNAHFNFNNLGVIAKNYYVNHYGDGMSGINAGLASDRLEAYWQLDAPDTSQQQSPKTGHFLVRYDGGEILIDTPEYDEDTYCIEIPYDLTSLILTNINKVKNWQLALRQTIITLFDAGYVVSGFVKDADAGRCWYVLSRESHT